MIHDAPRMNEVFNVIFLKKNFSNTKRCDSFFHYYIYYTVILKKNFSPLRTRLFHILCIISWRTCRIRFQAREILILGSGIRHPTYSYFLSRQCGHNSLYLVSKYMLNYDPNHGPHSIDLLLSFTFFSR